jgi:transcriptional regulator with XRE-family HTH domain
MARNIVGPRVREARKIAKPPVSQVDLAARIQVIGLKLDQSAISKIEKGRRPVADFEVVALAQALAVTVSWLLGQDCT